MSIRRTFFFLVNYALFTHNRRTIDGQYTHNKRTIPYTSSEDEDTISAFTPDTLRPILSLLLRLPSLLFLLYLALFHRPTTERRPRELRLISLTTKVLFIKIGFLKKLTYFLKRWTNFLKKLLNPK